MALTSQQQTSERTHEGRTRYAVCGLSNRAIGAYIPALTQDDLISRHAELVAVVDVDTTRMDAYKAQRGLDVPSFTPAEFERMVAETRPDVVIVTTPDGTHVDYVVQALAHDLDVITEKPMVIDSRQAKAIIDAEAKSRGSVRVTHNYRYTQAHMQIKRMILDGGMLGRITNVELAWNIDTYHGSSYFYRWNRDRAMSGGMTITKGCHHFDLLNWWLGDLPQQVFAYGALNYYGAKSPYNPSNIDQQDYSVREQMRRCQYRRYWMEDAAVMPEDDHITPLAVGRKLPNPAQYPDDKPMYIYDDEIDIEDTYSAVIRYRNGATVTYSANFSAPWEGYILAINGTKGRIETTHYTSPSRCPFPASERQPITFFPMFGGRQVHETRSVAGSHGGADPLLIRSLFVGETEDHKALGLAAGSREGAYAVAIGEAVWRSAEENRPINIDDLLPLDDE